MIEVLSNMAWWEIALYALAYLFVYMLVGVVLMIIGAQFIDEIKEFYDRVVPAFYRAFFNAQVRSNEWRDMSHISAEKTMNTFVVFMLIWPVFVVIYIFFIITAIFTLLMKIVQALLFLPILVFLTVTSFIKRIYEREPKSEDNT